MKACTEYKEWVPLLFSETMAGVLNLEKLSSLMAGMLNPSSDVRQQAS